MLLKRLDLPLKRLGLSLKRSDLSLERLDLSLKRSGLSLERSDLSLKRSGLSLKRSGLSLKLSGWSSESFKPKPEPERPGAVIYMHDSESQFLGTSMWTRFPLISKEIELPAWAAVVAISSAART